MEELELVVSQRSEDVDTVADPERAGEAFEAVLLALLLVPAVFADDEQSNIFVLPVTQQCEGADRDVDALQPLEPADKENDASVRIADLAARLGAIEGLEHRQVHTRRHDDHLFGIGAI